MCCSCRCATALRHSEALPQTLEKSVRRRPQALAPGVLDATHHVRVIEKRIHLGEVPRRHEYGCWRDIYPCSVMNPKNNLGDDTSEDQQSAWTGVDELLAALGETLRAKGWKDTRQLLQPPGSAVLVLASVGLPSDMTPRLFPQYWIRGFLSRWPRHGRREMGESRT